MALVSIAWVYFSHQSKSVNLSTNGSDVLDSPLNAALPDNDFSEMEEEDSSPDSSIARGKTSPEIEKLLSNAEDKEPSPKTDLESLLAKPMDLPTPQVLPPVSTLPDISSEVSFLNQIYEGRHVVYVLDVGDYVLQGEGSAQRFEQMKDAVLSSLVTLSPNSYFNLVLYWNLRETSALGKTILKANRENVKYAVDWITGLGSSIEDLQENRNQFVPKELLYTQTYSRSSWSMVRSWDWDHLRSGLDFYTFRK